MELKIERRHLRIISNYMSATISMDNMLKEMYKSGSYGMVENIIKTHEVEDDTLKKILDERRSDKLFSTARDEFVKEMYKEHFAESFYDSDCFKYIMEEKLLYMEKVTYDEDVTAPIPKFIRLTVEDYKKVYGVDEVDLDLFSEDAIEYGTSEFDTDNIALIALTVACSMMSLYNTQFAAYMSTDEFISYSLDHTRGVMDIYCDLFTTRTAEYAYTNSIQIITELCNLIDGIESDDVFIPTIREYFGVEVSDDVINAIDKSWVILE